jgi:hypothetical protein
MAIGERWMVYWEPTKSWRPAEIVNEAGKQVKLKFTDTPAARDLSNTLSTTRDEMVNGAKFRNR